MSFAYFALRLVSLNEPLIRKRGRRLRLGSATREGDPDVWPLGRFMTNAQSLTAPWRRNYCRRNRPSIASDGRP
jgi:hypothetical protein